MSEEVARIHPPASEISEEALQRAEEMIEQEEGVQNKFTGAMAAFITLSAVVMSLFHLYASYEIVRTEVLRATHVAFVLFLSFLIFPVARRFRHRVMPWDWALALLGVAICAYLISQGDDFFDRSITPNDWDILFGVALIVLVLEAMRRATGWIMPVITFCFLLYAFFGPYLPAPWTHKGYEIPRLVGHMYMTLEGIFGVAVDVSSSLIILFTIFGAFLQYSGAGKFYIDFSFSAMGGKPTGAGRTVVLASFLLGGPSGSGVATTVTLGAVAYPMLAKVGYGQDAAVGLLARDGGILGDARLRADEPPEARYRAHPVRGLQEKRPHCSRPVELGAGEGARRGLARGAERRCHLRRRRHHRRHGDAHRPWPQVQLDRPRLRRRLAASHRDLHLAHRLDRRPGGPRDGELHYLRRHRRAGHDQPGRARFRGAHVHLLLRRAFRGVAADRALAVRRRRDHGRRPLQDDAAVLEIHHARFSRAVHVRARPERHRPSADRVLQDPRRRRLGLDRAGDPHRRGRHRGARRRLARLALQAHHPRRADHAERRRLPARVSESPV